MSRWTNLRRRLTLAIRTLLGPGAEAETRARLLGTGLPSRRLPTEAEVVVGGQDASRAASRGALVAAVMGSSYAQTCAGRTATAIADTPLQVLDRDGAPLDAPIEALLNSYQGEAHGLVMQLALDLLVDGNAFCELVGEPTPRSPLLGRVVRHDPGDVVPIADSEGLSVVGYRVTTLARTYTVTPDRMAHARLMTIRLRPDHLLGVSPLQALLGELQGDRGLSDYLASRPHGTEDGVLLTSTAASTDELLDQVNVARRVRSRTGLWIAHNGATISALGAGVGAPRDELPLRDVLNKAVITALYQPPILHGFSVTNDSAARMQVMDAAEGRRDLAATIARSLQPILTAVLTPAQRLAGARLAFDWSSELALEALDTELKRADIAAKAIAAGADPAAAYEAQGLVWPAPATLSPAAEAAGLRLVRP